MSLDRLRAHGGKFGGGKYRSGQAISIIDELGFSKIFSEELYDESNQERIDGFAFDEERQEGFYCGYSTATGTNYIIKVAFAGADFTRIWEVNPEGTQRPSQLILAPDGVHFYVYSVGTFSKHLRTDGSLVSSFVNNALTMPQLSDDKQHIYGYASQKLYKLDLSLNIINEISTLNPWNSNYTLYKNLLMYKSTGATNGGVIYDADTGDVIQPTNTFYNDYYNYASVAIVKDGYFHISAQNKTIKINLSDGEVIGEITQTVNSNDAIQHLIDFGKNNKGIAVYDYNLYLYDLDNQTLSYYSIWDNYANAQCIHTGNLKYAKDGSLKSFYSASTGIMDTPSNQIQALKRHVVQIELK